MWSTTRITKLLGLDYPIIQGPFGGGLSSEKLVAAVSNAGGLGGFGIHHLSPAEIEKVDREIKSQTAKPYALNLWVSTKDPGAETYDQADFEKLSALFKPYFDELSIPLPEKPATLGNKFEDQVEGVLRVKPPALSFVFGVPSKEIVKELKSRNIRLIGTATTVDEALALEEGGMDAIVATGFEAGGHRVSFIRSAEASLTGTFVLTPLIADKVKLPVIAAGGIADGRGIVAALTLGADAVQIGTAFLACEESNATEPHREKLFSTDANYTVLTRLFSGRLARGLESRMTRELRESKDHFAPYPIQGIFLSALRNAAVEQGKSEMITFWSGQAAPLIKHRKAAELFRSLVAETESILNKRNK